MTGFVSLVGAGPGHPDLITIRGWKALQSADVILYDALLESAFLTLFPKGAAKIFVGKRCGQHSVSQDQLSATLLRFAQKGRRVVRLKGGDPFLFGRGFEEIEALRTLEIPFEVIPGVSAHNGVAAHRDLPLTHRGLASEVLIIQGHHLDSDVHHWLTVSRFRGTVVVYMGANRVQTIAQRMLAHGSNPETPIALVESDDTIASHTSVGTMREAARGEVKRQTKGPGIIYIGEVVRLMTTDQVKEESHVATAATVS